MAARFQSIFQPLKIGTLEVKNRTVMVAMGIHSPRLVKHDYTYTDTGVNYYVERAKGGIGLIVTGVMLVQKTFDITFGGHSVCDAGDEFFEKMGVLTSRIHEYGTKIVCQLSGGFGRAAPTWVTKGDHIAPSDDLPNVWNPTIKHRALTIEEIQMYIDGFAKGAKIAKQAGFDGVEIHAMHEGYLIDQFSMECSNHRTDKYGGSVENRVRFATEIVEAIKKECGKDFPVLIRYSVRSMMKGFNQAALPDEKFKEFGRDVEESIQVAQLLEKAGYDALDCDNGTYDSWFWPHPPVYMPDALNLEDCKIIKKHVKIPVICAGKMNDPVLAADVIAKGEIDAVGLARILLADPFWVEKVQNNDIEDIRPCISCQVGCLNPLFRTLETGCAINRAACWEKEMEITPAETKKKVLVIGGGIAGIEAARVSSLRGHQVVIYEKSDKLGGVFNPASEMSFKSAEKKLIKWFYHQIDKLQIKVHFQTEVTKKIVEDEKPDIIYLATGSRPNQLKIEGADNKIVLSAIDALNKKSSIGKKVVVIGGGLTGIEIAYDFSLSGATVDVVEVLPTILSANADLCAANEMFLKTAISHYKIGIHTSSSISKITENSVVLSKDGKEEIIQADTVISCIGYTSNSELYDSIKDLCPDVNVIGDASVVKNLMGAIWKAYELARVK